MLYQAWSINLASPLSSAALSQRAGLLKNTVFIFTFRHIPVVYRLPVIQFVPQKCAADGTLCLQIEGL